jgi:hypothetical protein
MATNSPLTETCYYVSEDAAGADAPFITRPYLAAAVTTPDGARFTYAGTIHGECSAERAQRLGWEFAERLAPMAEAARRGH